MNRTCTALFVLVLCFVASAAEAHNIQRVLSPKGIEAWLVDWNLAAIQSLDLACVDVHANDVVARIGQTGSCDEPNVARTKNGHAHCGKFLSDKEERASKPKASPPASQALQGLM